MSAAIGTIVVIAASFFAYSQIKEARLSRHVQLLISFQEKYHSPAARRFRHRLLSGEFGSPQNFDPTRMCDEDFHSFWQLHDQLEMLGVLVERKLLSFDLVLACFHRSPPRVWNAIEPYVLNRRAQASPLEGMHFERLVHRYRNSPALHAAYWDRQDVP
ncbi:DUF4760 domain-containing protein [Streptomyces sp. NBC_00582]|uniref:DUF4760 domain-containing protein n=1 Tax=Streptomyces sp. NBC_00582 TaxID=2975783 RepID=UPI001063D3FC|nr:hypothetical protein [Streptomyces sp. NBC_00582]WUB62260.1 hypothetical protein OG852_18590 [Streptomyces sp. NBC_00582]